MYEYAKINRETRKEGTASNYLLVLFDSVVWSFLLRDIFILLVDIKLQFDNLDKSMCELKDRRIELDWWQIGYYPTLTNVLKKSPQFFKF